MVYLRVECHLKVAIVIKVLQYRIIVFFLKKSKFIKKIVYNSGRC